MTNNICYSCFKTVHWEEAFYGRGAITWRGRYYDENCNVCGSDNAFYYARNDELQKAKEIFDKKPKEIKKERTIGIVNIETKGE